MRSSTPAAERMLPPNRSTVMKALVGLWSSDAKLFPPVTVIEPPGENTDPAMETVSPLNEMLPPGSTRITELAPMTVSPRTNNCPVNKSLAPFAVKLRFTGDLTPAGLTNCDKPGNPAAICAGSASQPVTTGWMMVPSAIAMPGVVVVPLTKPMPARENALNPPSLKNAAPRDKVPAGDAPPPMKIAGADKFKDPPVPPEYAVRSDPNNRCPPSTDGMLAS